MRKQSLNENWKFTKLPGLRVDQLLSPLPEDGWESVSLPHTWFREEDPWRGLAVYEKTIIPGADRRRA